MRNITPKVDGSGDVLLADAFNANLITELQNFVTNAGITLDPESGPDTDTSMFAKSVVIHALASQYFDDTGSANVYELSHSGGLESIPGYVDGSVVIFKAGTTNTGASSIEIDSLGAKNLVSDHGEALSGGEVIANQYIFARYRSDNDEFELLSSVGNFLRKDITDTLDYGVTIANETSYSAFNSLGTAYNVATLSGDILTIGYSLFPVSILSDGNLTHNGSIVWTEANAGTGSGLVADMVDGYHADSSPIPESGLLKVGDWGAARYTLDFTGLSVDDAFFTININGSNITGAPDTNSWFVSALGDGTNTAQMAFSQVDDKKIRVRGYNGVSWSNWSTPLSFEGHTHVETDIVDLDKYTQNEIDTAMALKADASLIGAASGICPLDAGSLVDSSYLPSYVDDVIEAADYASLPGTGETGKIYVTLDTGNIYRWTGSAYIEINTSVATADEAVALATARTIAIGGDATGSNTFDGTSNVTITVNVTDSEALGGVAAASWLRSDAADDVSGALTFSAAPVLQNAIMLSAITTGATTYGIAGINASDQAAIGNAALPLAFLSSGSITHNGDTIWTSGNDGVGSGLDADLLDGQQGSYYAVDSAVVHIAGAETVTGVINFTGTVGINSASPVADLEIDGKIRTTKTSILRAVEAFTTDNLYLIGNLNKDCLVLENTASASGIGNYGASISLIGPGGVRRSTAIASVQTTSDSDQVGLAFFTHPSTGGTDPLVENMRLSPSGDLDVTGTITGSQLISDVATGTAPFSVASTTVVTNLNADTVDGVQASNLAKLDSANDFETGITVADIEVVKGIDWTSRTNAADNGWLGVTYGNGLFVAVANSGTGNRVMTSPDGINWTSRTSAANNEWYSVTYGNGLFVAVALSGTGNRVMTSPDGINWTLRTSAADNNWRSVTYGNGLFVAVANTGTGNRVMTSPDGINWTSRTSAADNGWIGVTYGNGLFVAVANTGTGNRVMTSPDGINWTSRTSAADNGWLGVTYGNGLFVAVAFTGTGNRVMTSPDGINWTSRTSAADNDWYGVTYGNGLFVAVAFTGTGNRVMTSPDGINWTSRTSAADNDWYGVTYGNGLFVAVANTGTGNRVMTSGITNLMEEAGPAHIHTSIAGNDIYHTGNDSNLAKLGAENAFTLNQTIQKSGPKLRLLDTTDSSQAAITLEQDFLYISGNNIRFTDSLIENVDSFQVRHSGAYRDIYHTGNDSNLAKLNAANVYTATNTFSAANIYIQNALNIGVNGSGDSELNFWDDTNDAYRTLLWDDSESEWYAEDSSGTNRKLWHAGNLDFEEGTFTPVIIGSTTAGAGTYSVQEGFYQKVGNWVHFRLSLVWSAHTGVGNINVGGLPYTSNATDNAICSVYASNLAFTADYLTAIVNYNNTSISLYGVTGGVGSTAIPIDTAATLKISGSYQL